MAMDIKEIAIQWNFPSRIEIARLLEGVEEVDFEVVIPSFSQSDPMAQSL